MHRDRLRFLINRDRWLLVDAAELVEAAPDILKQLDRLAELEKERETHTAAIGKN